MMTSIEKMARETIEAWNAHDVNKLVSEVTEDTVQEDVALGRTHHGKTEFRDYVASLFSAFPDFRLDLRSVVASGERAVMEWVMTGTFMDVLQPDGVQPTGKSFSVRGTSVLELRGDKVKRTSDYYDATTMLQQLGISPSAA